MKIKFLIGLATVFFILGLAATSEAHSITLNDGDFTNWSFSQLSAAHPTQGSWGDMSASSGMITNTTYTPSGSTAGGVGVYNGFALDPSEYGGIIDVSMSIDWKSGPGAFGAGQAIAIVIFQDDYFYGFHTGTTGTSSSWTSYSSAPMDLTDSAFSWNSATGVVAGSPDFSEDGSPIRFGFAGTNSNSGTLTNYYDNWSMTINTNSAPVPEPATMFLFGSTLIGLVGIRRKSKK